MAIMTSGCAAGNRCAIGVVALIDRWLLSQ
jgi:hypothetical protein